MNSDASFTHRRASKWRRLVRTLLLILVSTFVLWLLLANHLILVPDASAFVVLKKTSWTFNSCFIGESSWTAFSLHHPILMSRLATGQGVWLIGSP